MIIIGLILLGLLMGAAVNYLADTLPWKRKLAKPFCIHCQAEMAWSNYFFWPRRCTACGKSRDWGVILAEIGFMGAMPLLWAFPPAKLGFWVGALVLFYFGVVVVIDIRYKLILHIVSLCGAVLGLAVGTAAHGLLPTLEGGLFGFGVMFLLYKAGELFIRAVQKRKGQLEDDVALGFGDVNLSGVLGLLVGFPGVVVSLFLGAIIGGVVSLAYLVVTFLLRRYKPLTALPYGPFLISGAVLLLFFLDLLGKIFQS